MFVALFPSEATEFEIHLPRNSIHDLQKTVDRPEAASILEVRYPTTADPPSPNRSNTTNYSTASSCRNLTDDMQRRPSRLIILQQVPATGWLRLSPPSARRLGPELPMVWDKRADRL
jgi:hypothetical protein